MRTEVFLLPLAFNLVVASLLGWLSSLEASCLDALKSLGAIAACVAVAVAWLAYCQNRKAARHAVQPILVFTRLESEFWTVQNVGKGVALDVQVGLGKHPDEVKSDDPEFKEVFRLYPLGTEQSVVLSVAYDDGFDGGTGRRCASYRGTDDRWYSLEQLNNETHYYEDGRFRGWITTVRHFRTQKDGTTLFRPTNKPNVTFRSGKELCDHRVKHGYDKPSRSPVVRPD